MENLQQIRKKKEELARLAEQNEQEAAKRKLSQDIERHIRTVFIGALDDIEKVLGWVWGYGKDREDLTEEELEELEHWERLRNLILNRGNSRLRAAVEEISKYTISPPKYNASFKFKD